MRALRQTVLLLAAVALLAGCATTGGSSRGMDSRKITADEIAETGDQVRNLYELIERLRPRWLEARSTRSMSGFTEIAVFQDQTYLGGTDELRQFGADYGVWLEYLDASQAVSRLPGLRNRSIGGAIVIHLQAPRQ